MKPHTLQTIPKGGFFMEPDSDITKPFTSPAYVATTYERDGVQLDCGFLSYEKLYEDQWFHTYDLINFNVCGAKQ